MDGLMLHCGAYAADLEEIEQVPTPAPTVTHFPIAHGSLIRHVRGQLLSGGVEIQEEAYGLSHGGARVFGVLALKAEHLPTIDGGNLILGIRNSHDRSFCAGLALGNVVFVCDNLSFYGTRTLARKHTRFAERDLPALIARILGKLGDWAARQTEMIAAYETTDLSDEQAHDFMIQAVRNRVIPPSKLTPVIDAFACGEPAPAPVAVVQRLHRGPARTDRDSRAGAQNGTAPLSGRPAGGPDAAAGRGVPVELSVWGGTSSSRLFSVCARQGALTWRCKSSTGPAVETVSRTARVSIVRWNLKEAAGKSLARRTETA